MIDVLLESNTYCRTGNAISTSLRPLLPTLHFRQWKLTGTFTKNQVRRMLLPRPPLNLQMVLYCEQGVATQFTQNARCTERVCVQNATYERYDV